MKKQKYHIGTFTEYELEVRIDNIITCTDVKIVSITRTSKFYSKENKANYIIITE